MTVTVQLSPEMEALIQTRVASGRSASADAVLAEALLALQEQDRSDLEKLERFQVKIQQSLDEADRGEFVDADAMFDELRERGRLMRQAAA